MTDERYGCLTFHNREVMVVGDVPLRMRITLDQLLHDFINRGVGVMSGGVIEFGHHEDGGYVWYQIVDWDPACKALILELDTTMREVGKKR